MTNPHEPVRMRFRGHMRRLPLMSFAAAFGRDVASTARALDTLIQGPPELPLPSPPSLPLPGEGGKGGGGQEQTQKTNRCDVDNKQNMGNGGAGERGIAETAKEIAAILGADTNALAIEKLAREHSHPLLHEALRRTKAIAPERIRTSPAAVFTGIVRRLAREGWAPDS